MDDFNWKIWFKKLGKGLTVTVSAAGILYVAEYIELSTLPADYAFWGGLSVTILNQIGNWIKHKFLA